MADGASGPEMGLTQKDLGIRKPVDKSNLPGGPIKMRPVSVNGVDYDPYHPPKLYKNPDGTTEYRGGKPLKDSHTALEAIASGQLPAKEGEDANSPAYKGIFEGVYDQMRQGASGKTPEEQGQRFIEGIAQKAQMHIGEIQSGNLTNQSIYQEIWAKMGAYINRYNGTPRFEQKKQDVSAVYTKLTGHINDLVQGGEVDPLTAKVFARYLERYKHIGGHHYNAIVRNNQELPDGILQQKAPEYSSALGRLVTEYGENAKEQESGGFMHFNAERQTGETTTRVYINPDLAQSPAQVLDAWHNALIQTGLKDKIYFKVSDGLQKRQEGIVVFLTDHTDPTDVEKLLTTFSATCPPDLLSSVPMPSAVPVTRGISMAPQLRNINTFLRYSGVEREAGVPEQISYNEWVASSTQLAFELAYHEATANGATTVTPKMLKEPAEKYFEKIVKLSGVNPDTMVPNALGGKRPLWAEKLAA